MSIQRTMGIETEYGIMGGSADKVLNGYEGAKKAHFNSGDTNKSAVEGMHDIGGHHGGDYQTIDEQLKESQPSLFSGIAGRITNRGKKVVHALSQAVNSYQDTGSIIENGSRFYIDMEHPEYSTAEVSNPRDVVIVDKAGERIVDMSAKNADSEIKIYKNNSDGKGNSFGCHENYLLKRVTGKEFEGELTDALIPFFITRQIYTGSGKIGVEIESKHGAFSYIHGVWQTRNEIDKRDVYQRQVEKTFEAIDALGKHFLDMSMEYSEVEKILKSVVNKRQETGPQQIYQLSQRADFFETMIGLGTTENRPLMNTRDEPHADKNRFMRLHVINGDANMCETATYLKTGTTALVLDLYEDKLVPTFDVQRPVKQFKDISLDQTRKWNVKLKDGKTISAVDMQKQFLEAAKSAYTGRDTVTDDVLFRWEHTLNALEKNPMQLFGQVDWVTKLGLITNIMDSKGAKLTDVPILNAALQYHDIDKNSGLYYYLEKNSMIERIVTDDEIAHAMFNPPTDTRAFLRGKATQLDFVSNVDWGKFEIKAGKDTYEVTLLEPFGATEEKTAEILKLKEPEKIVDALKKTKGISCQKKKIAKVTKYDYREGRNYYGSSRVRFGFDINDIYRDEY